MPPLSLQKGAAFMDMQTPDFETAEAATAAPSQLSRIATRCMLRMLAATLPTKASDDQEIAAEKWETARELFFAMRPRNPVEAALAARAVAAHFAAMDLRARAAQPGTSDEKAMRLHGKANAESRSFDAALRELGKRHAEAAKAAAAAETPPPKPARPAPSLPSQAAHPTPAARPGIDERSGSAVLDAQARALQALQVGPAERTP
jgi:hypothetical protein